MPVRVVVSAVAAFQLDFSRRLGRRQSRGRRRSLADHFIARRDATCQCDTQIGTLRSASFDQIRPPKPGGCFGGIVQDVPFVVCELLRVEARIAVGVGFRVRQPIHLLHEPRAEFAWPLVVARDSFGRSVYNGSSLYVHRFAIKVVVDNHPRTGATLCYRPIRESDCNCRRQRPDRVCRWPAGQCPQTGRDPPDRQIPKARGPRGESTRDAAAIESAAVAIDVGRIDPRGPATIAEWLTRPA